MPALVNKVANDYVRRAGINAVPDLVEYAEIASSFGRRPLAEAGSISPGRR